jgi:hypothetical protein
MSDRLLAMYLRRVESTALALEQACHPDALTNSVTDGQIEALANAVAAQADAIQAIARELGKDGE